MIVGANLQSSLPEQLNLKRTKHDALGLGSLCRARETAQTGRRVGFDKPLVDGIVEKAADDAQCVADGIAREISADSMIDQRFDVIPPDLIEYLFPKSQAPLCR
jgi:hypothetical protein